MSGGGTIGNYISVFAFVYQLLNPQKIEGPRLEDAQAQTSQEGIPIPFGYGTFPCAGNVIWAAPLIEHENEEGGKGGPVTVTYSYTRSYAIGICEGPITGLLRIKRNGKLVYDVSPTSTLAGKSAKFLDRCTIYLGDETQLVDPTIESYVGANATAPYRGLAYIVLEDDDVTDTQGAIPQYEFVVQMCGASADLADSRVGFVAALEHANAIATGTREGVWTSQGAEIGTVTRKVAARGDTAVCWDADSPENFYYSADRGVTWLAASPASATARDWRDVCAGPNGFVAVGTGNGADSGNSYIRTSPDGAVWTELDELTGIGGMSGIAYGGGIYVIASGIAPNDGIWTSADLVTWTQRSTATGVDQLYYNGSIWLAVGDNCKTYSSPDAITWTLQSQIGGGAFSFTCVVGGPGYFVAGASAAMGIFRTTDNGATWTDVSSVTGTAKGAARGLGTLVMGFNTSCQFSYDDGLTWETHTPVSGVNDVAFFGPLGNWFVVPDAPDLYADEDGNLIYDYLESQEELSACSVTVGEIVADLCERAGIDATEYDVSELTDTLGGYKCAREATAQAFIEPLTQGFFFDRGEWDKKLRFPKRGGSPVAALTVSDLVSRDGPVIDQTRVQEPELLWRVNVMTIDPAAGYNDGKQTAQRRVSTINAKGEATFELPIVCDADTAARIAEKRLKVAWAETDKFAFGFSLEYSKLTPTDVITLTDVAGKTHRVRLSSLNEERGVFTVEEAVKDRAATYASSATGVQNPNEPDPPDTVNGPTLFAAMNLPQLRTQDNSPGIYFAAAGVLAGWPGCQILLSLDGGLSYSVVRTITVPSTMGFLTADLGAADSPDILSVHVYGGTLESKTTAQVAAGANFAAVVTDDVAEVLAFEDATETASGYYDLSTLSRALLETVAADHATGDVFADLATVYFLPIDSAYAGTTLYFKAVTFGISPDAVDPVTLVYEATEYILDGGGA